MFLIENEAMLVDDREDLIAVLRMSFGDISGEIIQQIYEIDDMNILQRLILAAANAKSWHIFAKELEGNEDTF